jgi:hypothetical protein
LVHHFHQPHQRPREAGYNGRALVCCSAH